MLRDARIVNVDNVSTEILGPNPRRVGLMIALAGNPDPNANALSSVARAVDTSTTGVKLSLAGTTGLTTILRYASMFETAGSGVVAQVQLLRSGLTYILGSITTAGSWVGPFPMNAGDTFQLNVTTTQVASTADFTIAAYRTAGGRRVTVTFGNPAVIDQGIGLQVSGPPLILWRDIIGDSIMDSVNAIGSFTANSLYVVDLFL